LAVLLASMSVRGPVDESVDQMVYETVIDKVVLMVWHLAVMKGIQKVESSDLNSLVEKTVALKVAMMVVTKANYLALKSAV